MNFGLDPAIHAPKRLAFMALLVHAQDADFAFVRETLNLSDSNLSKQATALMEAGYIDITKSGFGRGSRTTFRITQAGRAAYLAHRQALEALLAGEHFEVPPDSST